MTDLQQFLISLSLLLLIDLTTVATRAAALYPHLGRMLNQREPAHPSQQSVLQLLSALPRLKASLNLSLAIERLLLGGMILAFLFQLSVLPSVPVLIGWLVLAALFVFTLGWVVEGVVSQNPAEWILRLYPYARLLVWVMYPLVSLQISWYDHSQVRSDDAGSLLADELRTLVDAGEQEGVLEQSEGRMISSIVDMSTTLAREIMVPRIDMLTLDVNTQIPEAVDEFIESGHSRVPVYRESVDNIIGLLYAKDLLQVWRQAASLVNLEELLRPAYFIPEAKRVNELLAELQAQRIHMAIVVDEYGGVAGLVTLEDIVEEILGEIRDEYDQLEELPYQKIGEDEYIFQGRVDLDDMNELLNCRLPKEDAETLGGFLYSQIGRVPSGGETIQTSGLLLTVEQVSGRRIQKVRVQRAPAELPINEDVLHDNGRNSK